MYIFRVLLNALLICTLVLPAPLVAFAADITPDPAAAAGNRPGMDAASNGVPVVNIVAPTKSGLSHNMYLDFNVGKQGVIINNSNKPGISQLGGGMMGNPKFGGGAQATTILNEVTSNRPSSIQGFTEIFGGKADYILANPNGVSINGGGFINTSRAIMTTGVPQVAGGKLNSIEVNQGSIAIEGDGVNANGADSFTILSRAATIAADVHAKRLALVAGRNSYDPATEAATALADDPAAGPAPTVAVDSAALGGMYANRILLVATEKGVGVNLQGAVKAGSLSLSADGKLSLKQAQADANAEITAGTLDVVKDGTLVAQGDITVTADVIDNSGLTYSGGKTSLLADTSITNKAGSIVAKGDLSMGDSLASSPTVDVAIKNEGGLVQSLDGNVDITAGSFLNKVESVGVQRVLVESSTTSVSGPYSGFGRCGTETTTTKIRVYEDRLSNISPTPQVMAGNNLSIEAQNLVNANGLILAKKEMALKGSKLENKGVRLYRDTHVEISKHGSYTASDGDGGEKTTSSHKEYDSSTLLSTVPSTIAAGGTLDLDFTKQVNNDTIKRTDDYVSLAGAADGASGRVNLSVAGIGSLFTPAPEASKFVYTTNPGIPSLKALYGSEYFLSRVGWDLDKHHQKLLGDAFFETQLVRRQIAELNSRSVVASIDQPDEAVMLALMDNAVAEGSSLNLTVGVELTKAQLDALTKDIIWLVEEEHNGQTVLVPKVYLAKASRSTVSPNGVVMAAKDIRLKTASLTNSGSIAGDNVQISADEVRNLGGMIEGGALVVDASGTILNRSGIIKGGDISLTAGKDIVSETTKHREYSKFGHRDRLDQIATIESAGSLSMQAGDDVRIKGGKVAAGGDASVSAGNDVTLGAVSRSEAHKQGRMTTRAIRQQGSTLDAGGELKVTAGRDVNVLGSAVSSGEDMSVSAGEHVNLAAVQETYESIYKRKKKGGLFGGSKSTVNQQRRTVSNGARLTSRGGIDVKAGLGGGDGGVALVGSAVVAEGEVSIATSGEIVIASSENSLEIHKKTTKKGFLSSSSSKHDSLKVTQVGSAIVGKNVNLNAEKNASISASDVQADNNVSIKSAEGDVKIVAAQNRDYSHSEKSKSSAGFWVHGGGIDIHRSTQSMNKEAAETNVGSQIAAGNNVSVEAANDATVVGSQLSAGNDVTITAGRDVNLVPGRESSKSESRSKTTATGLSWSFSENEISIGGGTKSVEVGETIQGQYNRGSIVSAGNDVSVTADRNINQVSSHIEAGHDVAMTAKENINVSAAQDVEELDRFVRETEVGVKAAVKQNVTSTIRQLAELPSAMQAGKGGGAEKGITAVSAALRGVSAVQGMVNTSISGSITGGLSLSQSKEHTETETPVTSTISAGNDVSMKADQDISIEGAQVYAGNNVTLDAGRDLTVESATGSMTYDADSMSVAAGGGVKGSVGTGGGGWGANAYASVSGSKNDYESINHRNAVVKAEKELSTTSGRDTTVAGAHLQGETVTMKVGEDLAVASRQDKSEGSSASYGVSADVMIGMGASGSLSANVGKGKNSSGWVHDQTSIIGEEKVDIRVEDNTHVGGAVIAAKNGNLKLDTNTLTYGDIHDHDKASNINVGVSVSGSYGGGGEYEHKSLGELMGSGDGARDPEPTSAKDDNSDKGFHSPSGSASLDYSTKDRRQINRATIGEGTIAVRSDPDASLEGLNRDLARSQEITKDSETYLSAYIDPGIVDMLDSAKELFRRLVSDGKLTEDQKKEHGIDVVLSDLSYAEEKDKNGNPNPKYEENKKKMQDAGFEIVPQEDFDMTPFNNDKIGLASTLFYNKEKNEYVLAFRGTEMSKKDWVTNGAQAIGATDASQYGDVKSRAITKLNDHVMSKGATLTVTGHSLGGGLATMVVASGFADRAVVFNPAGLHDNSIAAIGGSREVAEQKTTAYISKLDVLNLLQDLLCGAIPKVIGKRVYVDDGGIHGIEGMKKPFGLTP
ncbi:hemagglutinin repeat-containing protein [Desulfovibrio subterraneus]|uniref:hemagglutinin repeat-containing protein n=1 Tax=Desulfovibrio subterraneus TaxID=2718620 RepID=UPI0022B9262C|nr:hemagglutinin repeat-containing protein [Desulfovibrio subterraneus]WBF66008.1 hemagglutinin repeat-containing protein [Desulfovibrio subterraneus]